MTRENHILMSLMKEKITGIFSNLVIIALRYTTIKESFMNRVLKSMSH